jgi:hypothetical protein
MRNWIRLVILVAILQRVLLIKINPGFELIGLLPVFRIRDILVRIRIRGSVFLTIGSVPYVDSDPALFVSLSFCLSLVEGTLASYFKDKKS